MTTNDELPQNIVNSLRDVTPASDSVRDMHIANALAELRTASTQSRRRPFLLAAAAAVFVTVGAAVVMQSQHSASPAMASHEVHTLATVPAKGAIGSVDTTISSVCATSSEKVVGSYQLDDKTAVLIETAGGVRVAVDSACDTTTYLPFPAHRPSAQHPADCSAPGLWEMLLVAHFEDANGYFHWVGINNHSVEMFDCSSSDTTVAHHPQI